MIRIDFNEEGKLDLQVSDELDPLQALGLLKVAEQIILGVDVTPSTSGGEEEIPMDEELDGTGDLDGEFTKDILSGELMDSEMGEELPPDFDMPMEDPLEGMTGEAAEVPEEPLEESPLEGDPLLGDLGDKL